MGTELVNKETGEIKKAEPTASERFTAMVINEFKGNVGELNLNDYQEKGSRPSSNMAKCKYE